MFMRHRQHARLPRSCRGRGYHIWPAWHAARAAAGVRVWAVSCHALRSCNSCWTRLDASRRYQSPSYRLALQSKQLQRVWTPYLACMACSQCSSRHQGRGLRLGMPEGLAQAGQANMQRKAVQFQPKARPAAGAAAGCRLQVLSLPCNRIQALGGGTPALGLACVSSSSKCQPEQQQAPVSSSSSRHAWGARLRRGRRTVKQPASGSRPWA